MNIFGVMRHPFSGWVNLDLPAPQKKTIPIRFKNTRRDARMEAQSIM